MYSSLIFLSLLFLCSAYDWKKWTSGSGGGGNEWWPGKPTTDSSVEVKCGTNKLGNIVIQPNGTRDAIEGEITWQVSVQLKATGAVWQHGCGGTVINKHFVLTSANCINNLPGAFIRVEAGIVDAPKGGYARRKRQIQNYYDYPGANRPGLKYIQRTHVHPDYDSTTLANNIVLLRLAVPFEVDKVNGTINSICLPKANENFDEQQLLITGWGILNKDDKIRPKLQVIKGTLLPKDNCTDGHLCITEELSNNETDSCEGDIGGPLVATDGKTATLIGIHSSGSQCKEENIDENTTMKFTKIDSYVKWILETAVSDY